jgi:hypothetical protein
MIPIIKKFMKSLKSIKKLLVNWKLNKSLKKNQNLGLNW